MHSPLIPLSQHESTKTSFMRESMGWVGTGIGNFVVSCLTIWIGLLQVESQGEILTMMMVAVAIFAVMELVKFDSDFGLVQYFVSVPLQWTLMYCNQNRLGLGVMHVATTSFLFFGTFLYAYRGNRWKTKKDDREFKMQSALVVQLREQLQTEINGRKSDAERQEKLETEKKGLESEVKELQKQLKDEIIGRKSEVGQLQEKLETENENSKVAHERVAELNQELEELRGAESSCSCRQDKKFKQLPKELGEEHNQRLEQQQETNQQLRVMLEEEKKRRLQQEQETDTFRAMVGDEQKGRLQEREETDRLQNEKKRMLEQVKKLGERVEILQRALEDIKKSINELVKKVKEDAKHLVQKTNQLVQVLEKDQKQFLAEQELAKNLLDRVKELRLEKK